MIQRYVAMKSWMGNHQGSLIDSWGPPDRITDDGRGGRILIWEKYVRTGQTPGRWGTNWFGGRVYTAPVEQSYTRSRMFWVNADGIVYSWRWKGA